MKKIFHGLATTYAQLKARVAAILLAKGISPQQVMNNASALNGWMRRLALTDASLIGQEMMSAFDDEFLRHQDHLIETLSRRTARDQSEHLLTWRRHAEECMQIDTLPADFKGAFNQLFSASGMSKAELARASGVRACSIRRWLGLPGLPVPYSAPEIGRLEQALQVPQGTLLNRLPNSRYTRFARTVKKNGSQQTAWGKKRTEERKTLGPYALPLSGTVHEQLLDCIDFKSDGLREGANKVNSWRTKPASETGCRILKAMVARNGMICVTAFANWSGFSSYLGFLCLKPQGKGLPQEDVSTLAWLIHFPFLMDYVRWLLARAGGKMHCGIPKFLDDVKCMVRPKTGFLWSRPDIANTLPDAALVLGQDFPLLDAAHQAERWREVCAATHLKLREKVKAIRGGKTGKVQHSRNPKEPVANVLSSPSPLKVLLQFIHELESNPPPMLHHRSYVVWLRDVLFSKMIVSNPLRISHFAVMRYSANNTGNLYQSPDGEWRLRFPAAAFKNEKGAAFEDYEVSVESSIGPWIKRYLAESRPHAIGACECDFLFLPFVPGPNRGARADGDYDVNKEGMWTGNAMSVRMRVLTRQYISDTPGFGAHAVRGVVATDFLLKNPQSYFLAARLLHDKFETVARDYAHLTVDQGLRALYEDIGIINAELRKGVAR
jgi:hypothetical protein